MTTSETAIQDLPDKTIDPVCGMDVEPGKTTLVSAHRGKRYWFCAEGCRKAFEENPDKYLEPKAPKKKGWFGRYLDRMAKNNEKEFGCAGPRCH